MGTTAFTVAGEADRLEAAIAAAGLDEQEAEQVFDSWINGGVTAAERRIKEMKTRQQELTEFDQRIEAARQQLAQSTDKAERARLDRQLGGAAEARKLLNQRYDRQEAEQAARAADAQARLASVEQQQDAEIRSQLRARWQGSQADFERMYPELRDQWLADRALGRTPGPAVFGPKVTI